MNDKCIKLKYEGKVYELAFTREIVSRMERAGFDFQALVNGTKPGSMSAMLFSGAFMARNRKIKSKLIDEIYAHLSNKTDLIVKLAEMYSDTLETLTEEAAEDDGKNVTWEEG